MRRRVLKVPVIFVKYLNVSSLGNYDKKCKMNEEVEEYLRKGVPLLQSYLILVVDAWSITILNSAVLFCTGFVLALLQAPIY